MFKLDTFFRLFSLLLTLLLTSCEKIDNEYSDYVISIDNETTIGYKTDLYLDGEYKQTVTIEPNSQASYINSCDEASISAERLINTFIIKEVKSGEHKVEIKSDNNILKTLIIIVRDENCIMQFTSLK